MQYTLPQPVAIYSTDHQLLATVNSLDITIDSDPAVHLNYAITAGATSTHVNVAATPVDVLPPLTNPNAYATAQVTLTDGNGDGASIAGRLTGGAIYEAQYNGGTLFAGLFKTGVTAPADSSNIATDRSPGSGYTIINDTVTSTQSAFDFDLSASDQVSVTSTFAVSAVPLPAACWAGMLMLGGVGVMGFRRRCMR